MRPSGVSTTDPPLLRAAGYGAPLREGGPLPAILEATDEALFVTEFTGAGQGPRALTDEPIAGLLDRHLRLPVPELALIDLPESIGCTERDPAIQDTIQTSHLQLGRTRDRRQ